MDRRRNLGPNAEQLSLSDIQALLDFVREIAEADGPHTERARSLLAEFTETHSEPEQVVASAACATRQIGDTFLSETGETLIWTDQGIWADHKDVDRARLRLDHDQNGWPHANGVRVPGTLFPVSGDVEAWDPEDQ